MTITIPDTLTLTSSLKEALLKAVTTITFNGYHQNGFNSQIDLEKLDVANALLAALSLPTHPPSPFNDASTPAPVAFRRRAIPFEKRARIVARDGFRCVECGARDGLEIDGVEGRQRRRQQSADALRRVQPLEGRART